MSKKTKTTTTKTTDTTPRTTAVIRMEYLQECSRAGEIQYRLINDPELLAEANQKIRKLQSEFNKVAAIEQANAPQQPANG